MPNAWVNHVKQYAATNKISYGCALSMSECKSSYKSKKEPKKESKPKESEIKDTKVYTMYKKPIGPVKPVKPAPKQQEEKPQSYYKDMIAMAMKDYTEPKIKIPKSKNKTI
jgi:hypothetical protein